MKIGVHTLLLASIIFFSKSLLADDEIAGAKALNPIQVSASNEGYSVIEIKGRKIFHVDADKDHCDINVIRTKSLGKVVFKPKTEDEFVIYVTDENGTTYPLIIKPSKEKKPSVLQIDPTLHKKVFDENYVVTKNVLRINSPRNVIITNLIKYSFTKKVPSNVEIKQMDDKIYLWQEVNIKKVAELKIGGITAKKLLIQNVSKDDVIFNEKEFYPYFKNTLAVSIKALGIKPKETTEAVIVVADEQ